MIMLIFEINIAVIWCTLQFGLTVKLQTCLILAFIRITYICSIISKVSRKLIRKRLIHLIWINYSSLDFVVNELSDCIDIYIELRNMFITKCYFDL